MNSKYLFLFLAVPLLFLAAGCSPECNAEEIQSFNISLETPANGAVVDYNGQFPFEWTHQETCTPSRYRITFVREDNETNIASTSDGTQTIIEQWMSFGPGFTYQWYVEALLIEENSENGGDHYIHGPSSESGSFTTSGICSGAELQPPVLSSPEDGEVIDQSPSPSLDHYIIDWRYPGDCYPESFHYQAAADPNFLNMITSGQIIFKDYYTSWDYMNDYYAADIPVPGCAQIYWRVEAKTGNDSGGFSETRNFTYFEDPSCFLIQEPGSPTLIKGYVFADYCKSTRPWIPDGVDIWPPCIFGEPHGVHADGNRNHAAGENETTGEPIPFESGISDVVVDLGSGPCPSTGLDQMTTMNNGGYYFMVPSPGEYCLSVSKVTNPALDHGIWTLPLTSDPVTQTTIVVGEGESLVLQNFGWDQNDYIQIEFLVDLLSFCRVGDSKDYPEVAVLEEGSVIPVYAKNTEGTWFATIVDGRRCFISIASGTPNGDPDELMTYPKLPPHPVEEPEHEQDGKPANCSSYTTQESCSSHGCQWINFAAGGTCNNP